MLFGENCSRFDIHTVSCNVHFLGETRLASFSVILWRVLKCRVPLQVGYLSCQVSTQPTMSNHWKDMFRSIYRIDNKLEDFKIASLVCDTVDDIAGLSLSHKECVNDIINWCLCVALIMWLVFGTLKNSGFWKKFLTLYVKVFRF